MKMKKRYQLLLIASLLFIIDFGLTWFFLNYTDYADEGNPLFRIDGGTLSLIINFIYFIIVFVVGCMMDKYQTILLDAEHGFDYFKKLYQSDRTDFIMVSFLSSFVYATFVARLTAIVDWIIFGIYRRNFYQTAYATLRAKMPFERYDVTVIFISFILFLVLWYQLEFRKSKKELVN